MMRVPRLTTLPLTTVGLGVVLALLPAALVFDHGIAWVLAVAASLIGAATTVMPEAWFARVPLRGLAATAALLLTFAVWTVAMWQGGATLALPFGAFLAAVYVEHLGVVISLPRDCAVETRRLLVLWLRAAPIGAVGALVAVAALVLHDGAPDTLGPRLLAMVAALAALGVPVWRMARQ